MGVYSCRSCYLFASTGDAQKNVVAVYELHHMKGLSATVRRYDLAGMHAHTFKANVKGQTLLE
jgi:hypothetical protein